MIDSYTEVFGNKNKIMVVMAHPDDAEVFAGGTIARLIKDKKQVCVVKVTNGSKGSRDNNISASELVEIRKREDNESMKVLGVDLSNSIHLGFEDGYVEDSIETIGAISKIIRKFKPDIIITHNPQDMIINHSGGDHWVNHRDHRNTGKSATDAAYPYSRDLLFFPEQFSEEGIGYHKVCEFLFADYYLGEDIVEIDITEFKELKETALTQHKSQFSEEKAKNMVEFMTTRDNTDRKFECFKYVVAD